MQLSKDNTQIKSNAMSIEARLADENKYLTNLFSIIAFPDIYVENEDEDEGDQRIKAVPLKKPKLKDTKTSRAQSIEELQKRLELIQSKRKQQTFKDKLKKNTIKNQIKKNAKQDERNALKKLAKANKLKESPTKTETNMVEGGPAKSTAKPIYNSEGKMVFSKFDFSGLGSGKGKDKKGEKDPAKVLESLNKQKEKLQKLEAEGQVEKAIELKDKAAWKNAIARAEGEKVKDDPILLKKSVQKEKQKKKSSKKKWDKRIANVEQSKDERQKKRQENIEKRQKTNKMKKLKSAAKRGKIIPGF